MPTLIHPLTTNRWSVEGEPEYGRIRLSRLHQLERARLGIETIARLVGNSALEPNASGASPFDAETVARLMGGVESLCEHIGILGETIQEESSQDNERTH